MPYLTEKERARLDGAILLLARKLYTKGEVNYAVTKLTHLWIEYLISLDKKNYETLSKGYDVLSEAAGEYKQAVLDRYEAKKRIENGAISSLDAVNL